MRQTESWKRSWRTGKTETFVYKDKKKLRCGYTTGTCAALAAKAAVSWLVTGIMASEEEILTPKGESVRAPIENWRTGFCKNDPEREPFRPDGMGQNDRDGTGKRMYAECAVRKDAGDDHDVTDGLLICVRARFAAFPDKSGKMQAPQVWIDGGIGVGRVTKPGLDQPVGAAAINSIPRQMITDAVRTVLEECGEVRSVEITVFVPDGEAAAEKTFNPVLGIKGGISILGTSGIVEPMSEEALVETIRAHLKVLRAEGKRFVLAVPGNMGAGFLRRYLKEEKKLPENMLNMLGSSFLVCSNFVGKTVDMAGELGFQGFLLAGHMGKLVKIGNGIMNTHSREGDGRMDTLLSCALSAGGDLELLKKIRGANTTEEAMKILRKAALMEKTVAELLLRMDWYMERRAMDGLKTGLILFDSEARYLGGTKRSEEILLAAVTECKAKSEDGKESDAVGTCGL